MLKRASTLTNYPLVRKCQGAPGLCLKSLSGGRTSFPGQGPGMAQAQQRGPQQRPRGGPGGERWGSCGEPDSDSERLLLTSQRMEYRVEIKSREAMLLRRLLAPADSSLQLQTCSKGTVTLAVAAGRTDR